MMLCLFDENGAETQIPMQDYDADICRVFVSGSGWGTLRDTGPRVPTIRPGGCAVAALPVPGGEPVLGQAFEAKGIKVITSVPASRSLAVS